MIITYIQEHWYEWLFSNILGILGILFHKLWKKIKEESVKNDAVAEGVQALLRDSIVSNYNKYSDKKYCPIYAKESIKRAYDAYHKIGGNDVATKLYEKMLLMPEEDEESGV